MTLLFGGREIGWSLWKSLEVMGSYGKTFGSMAYMFFNVEK